MKIVFPFFVLLNISLLVTAQTSQKHSLSKTGDPRISTSAHRNFQNYDVNFYKLDVEVNDSNTFVKGNTSVRAKITGMNTDSFNLELASNMLVDSVFLNGRKTKFNHDGNYLDILPDHQLKKGNLVTAQVYYQGKVVQNNFFSGMSNQTDRIWGNRVTWTLSEPWHARDWFPCKQDLNDKADSAWIFITTAPGLKAGSNGVLTHVTHLADGRLRYEWKTRHSIAFYLLSLSVSKYAEYDLYAHPKGMNDSILIQNYIYNDSTYLKKYKSNIDKAASILEFYCDRFGPYPFANEKYGHCLAPLGGGMENQTMTTLSDFSFDLVAHEMAHQWFGDNVTCASFQDVWLNEGFASYSEYLSRQQLISQQSADEWMREAQAMAKSKSFQSIFVPSGEGNDEWRVFDMSMTYKKGAVLLHMIRYELGDSLFFKVLKDYQVKFAGKTASVDDFKELLKAESNRDFSTFFDQWYYGQGYPVFHISWDQDGDQLSIVSKQSSTSTQTPFFNTYMEYKILYENGDSILKLKQDRNTQTFLIKTSKKVIGVEADPNNWILKSIVEDKFINDAENNPFLRISPNPFKRHFELVFLNKHLIHKVNLIDADSNTVYETMTMQDKLNIDTHLFKPGIYILTLKEGEKQYKMKITKK